MFSKRGLFGILLLTVQHIANSLSLRQVGSIPLRTATAVYGRCRSQFDVTRFRAQQSAGAIKQSKPPHRATAPTRLRSLLAWSSHLDHDGIRGNTLESEIRASFLKLKFDWHASVLHTFVNFAHSVHVFLNKIQYESQLDK
jgi:hypothetical protein